MSAGDFLHPAPGAPGPPGLSRDVVNARLPVHAHPVDDYVRVGYSRVAVIAYDDLEARELAGRPLGRDGTHLLQGRSITRIGRQNEVLVIDRAVIAHRVAVLVKNWLSVGVLAHAHARLVHPMHLAGSVELRPGIAT